MVKIYFFFWHPNGVLYWFANWTNEKITGLIAMKSSSFEYRLNVHFITLTHLYAECSDLEKADQTCSASFKFLGQPLQGN